MRNKEHNITLPMIDAEKVLQSKDQIIMLRDENNNWTGEIINTSEIIATHRDRDEEKHENYNSNQIEEPEYKPIDISKFKPYFLKKPIDNSSQM